MAKEQFSFSVWKKENQQLVDDIFSKSLLKSWAPKEMVEYIKQVMHFFEFEPKRDFFTYHELQYKAGDYFRQIEWGYHTSYNWENMFEFDIAAEKNSNQLLFKIKPYPTIDDIEQAGDYANHVGKRDGKPRVFLATDLLNFDRMLQGQLKKQLLESANNYNLGIFFSNRNQSWLIPSEFMSVLKD